MGEYIPRDAQDRPINPAHCKAATPSFVKGRFFQCQRKAAGYCWQHQPERVAERAEKSRQHRESSLSGKELRVQRDALMEACEAEEKAAIHQCECLVCQTGGVCSYAFSLVAKAGQLRESALAAVRG